MDNLMAFNFDKWLADQPEKYREQTRLLYEFIRARANDLEPKSYGNGIVGWGDGDDDWFLVGLAARKGGAMLYASAGELDRYDHVFKSRRTGITCLKITRWGAIDEKILDEVVRNSLAKTQREYAGKTYGDRAKASDALGDFETYLAGKPEEHRETARKVYQLVQEISGGEPARKYDDNVIGFGEGKGGWYRVTMAVRSSGVMLYTSPAVLDRHSDTIKKSHRTGKGCLRLSKSDVYSDELLRDIIERSWNG